MARNRKDLGGATESRIVALMRAGGTADSITAQLGAEGVQASRATIARRMQELRGTVQAARAEKAREAAATSKGDERPLPASPDAIPEGTDLETLDRWLKTAERMGELAESDGDLSALAAAGRLSASLLEAKRKATPPRAPDPNENPDLRKLGAEVAARLHKMIEQVTT